MYIRSLFIFLLSTLFIDTSLALDESEVGLTLEIEAAINKYSRAGRPGYALVVLDGDKAPSYFYSGFSNVEHQVPIDQKTVFDLASISKTFTGYAVALLVEKKQLRLSDPITKYIQELPERYDEITIKHLLHHTSGLWEWSDALTISGYVLNEEIIGIDRVLTLVTENDATNFVPGEKWGYSNTNYTLLAEVISRISGKPFETYINNAIFEPLKMSSASIARKGLSVRHFATSYKEENGEYIPHPYGFAAQGSSSALMSISDLAKWLNNYHSIVVGDHGTHELTQAVTTLNDGTTNNYGFGVKTNQHNRKYIGHDGQWKGYLSEFRHYPKDQISVGILCNSYCNHREILKTTFNAVMKSKGYDSEIDQREIKSDNKTRLASKHDNQVDLKKFVGKYKILPGWFMSVEIKNNRLIGYHQHYSKFETEIKAIDANTLYVEKMDTTIIFSSQENSDIVWSDADGSLNLERLASNDIERTDLKAYSGTYINESLGALYTVSVESGALIIKHAAHGTENMTPFNAQYFLGEGKFIIEVKFELDENGNALGFTLASPRISSIHFRKI